MSLALLAQATAEPSVTDVLGIILTAVLGKKYTLLGVAALVLLVFAARKGGAKVLPWLATPRGSALLAFLGGGSTWLLTHLGMGEQLTPELISEAIKAALTASGLWSTGKAIMERCTPIEIANGTCKPLAATQDGTRDSQ